MSEDFVCANREGSRQWSAAVGAGLRTLVDRLRLALHNDWGWRVSLDPGKPNRRRQKISSWLGLLNATIHPCVSAVPQSLVKSVFCYF